MSSGASRDDAGATPFGAEALTAPLPEPGEAGLRGEAGRGASRMVAARAMFVSAVLVLGAGVLALLFVLSVQSIAGGSGLSWATIVIAAVMVLRTVWNGSRQRTGSTCATARTTRRRARPSSASASAGWRPRS